MHDIDTMLAALNDEGLPAQLATIDGPVMKGLGAYGERQFSRRGMVLAIGIAGFLGLSLGIDGGAPAAAEPLLAMPASAPSHLLND
ncbi:hypothetical protein EKN06_02710 [Croceicoccus ponticola]|uniref:Uncharacterized protein n=1 Tax=Croceicoccus ponticola TaxID=2217664 RepID=A0A437H0G2_9SPHN|nr:hypothetical protein [Croceicoccus ponticola]RVQ69134.1 hypothetical protein EKN06_02710 [Croceicoccus ponticola]